MRRKRLALRLVVIQHAYLAADELHNPNDGVIGLGASATDVPERFQRKQRIGVALRYAPRPFCCRQHSSVVSPERDFLIIAFPNMIVLLGLIIQARETFLIKRFVPPSIIAPVCHDVDGAQWRRITLTEENIDGVHSSPWVPGKPQFRARSADGRTQNVE